eukprot:CAMPEP_0184682942 /NCGR_PEP_ID=MMETSP0312-20130426/9327_1 /TAXON_ID=31354 /ORGANISM="Compsopogon coeruleus, Strain SAG 36.94" /LENGTH=244 /DNA_ID=CAMNT_0027134933 /DNA_START=55 /DNA_END=789 /DNA_ORIENTATION=+
MFEVTLGTSWTWVLSIWALWFVHVVSGAGLDVEHGLEEGYSLHKSLTSLSAHDVGSLVVVGLGVLITIASISVLVALSLPHEEVQVKTLECTQVGDLESEGMEFDQENDVSLAIRAPILEARNLGPFTKISTAFSPNSERRQAFSEEPSDPTSCPPHLFQQRGVPERRTTVVKLVSAVGLVEEEQQEEFESDLVVDGMTALSRCSSPVSSPRSINGREIADMNHVPLFNLASRTDFSTNESPAA